MSFHLGDLLLVGDVRTPWTHVLLLQRVTHMRKSHVKLFAVLARSRETGDFRLVDFPERYLHELTYNRDAQVLRRRRG